VSHLNEQLSALVDGELNGTELDRVNGHLASCEQCRSEAAALRLLKRELRGLTTMRHSDDLTRKLLAMAGPGGPVPPREHHLDLGSRPRAAFRAYPDRPRWRPEFGNRASRARPGSHAPGDAWARRRRSRSLILGALSLVVTIGVGALALALSGAGLSSGSRISPQMELYSIEHAFISGDIPVLFNPQSPPAKGPKWKPAGSPAASVP
jgi:anti-sigma factor RsiW